MKILSWQPPVKTLPNDIIMEIFSRLPVKTLVRFKSASKSFLNLIISPEFVKLHLRRSLIRNSSVTLLHWGEAFLASFDFDHPQRPVVQLDVHPDVIKLLEPYRYENNSKLFFPIFIGICNGVVCFSKAKEFILYNPATRVYRQIPRLRMRELCRVLMPNDELNRSMFSDLFVYDCNADDFKIFMSVHHSTTNQNDFEFYLYSLKDNSWLTIETLSQGNRVDPSHTHIANSSLYWVTSKINNGLETKVIMRFDLSSHGYEEMPTPRQINPADILTVRVLKGRPHILILGDGALFDIWMITEDNCWTRLFRWSKEPYPWMYNNDSPFWQNYISRLGYAYSSDGRKILVGPVKRLERYFVCCDLESQTTSEVQTLGLPEVPTLLARSSWAESLVPLA